MNSAFKIVKEIAHYINRVYGISVKITRYNLIHFPNKALYLSINLTYPTETNAVF